MELLEGRREDSHLGTSPIWGLLPSGDFSLPRRRANFHLGSAWDNMNTIVGLKERGRRKLEFESKPDSVLAEDLNRLCDM